MAWEVPIVVGSQGVSPDPENVSTVQQLQPPKMVRQTRAFLGYVGYYRQFIKDFVKIAKPRLLMGTGHSGRWVSPQLNEVLSLRLF